MQKIAILSDIHGNLPALEAVLEDIQQREVAKIFCLGDLVGKGPSSDICVDLVNKHCEQVIMGNWEDFMTKESDIEAIQWHQAVLGEQRMRYLGALPFSIEFVMSGKFIRLFHASPRSLYERIQPWDALDKRLSLFDYSELCERQKRADVVGYGDIHNAYLQHISGKPLFNAGSVGNPLDITQASYVILEGLLADESAAPLNIQFVRVPYDIELSIKQAAQSGMPLLEPYIKELRTARYRGLQD
ncbi:metallophosphoesterase family protein [Paenibacillus sp. Soil522]|uniref:metallophosphoesterase family protein n=1 Tax=Paenibacillus sp. Soil522 TaxID=1736388 RepID=UPI0006FA693E|nr:metallophosphoesterase family protein [Paenibacillus sp. Soil522]KRE48796.1 serine/threonine protein phosphatase [Paenibacillus sp. Soil522]